MSKEFSLDPAHIRGKCLFAPNSDGEHLQHWPALDQADHEDEPDDAEGVQGQLFAELVHACQENSGFLRGEKFRISNCFEAVSSATPPTASSETLRQTLNWHRCRSQLPAKVMFR